MTSICNAFAGAPLWNLQMDFTVGTASPVDPHWLYLLACCGAVMFIGRMSDDEWRTADTRRGRS